MSPRSSAGSIKLRYEGVSKQGDSAARCFTDSHPVSHVYVHLALDMRVLSGYSRRIATSALYDYTDMLLSHRGPKIQGLSHYQVTTLHVIAFPN